MIAAIAAACHEQSNLSDNAGAEQAGRGAADTTTSGHASGGSATSHNESGGSDANLAGGSGTGGARSEDTTSGAPGQNAHDTGGATAGAGLVNQGGNSSGDHDMATGGTSSGGHAGTATGGTGDAGVSGTATVSAAGTPSEAGGPDAGAVRACTNASALQPANGCRVVADCQGVPPIECCDTSPCWPESACPIPPSMCGRLGSGPGSECASDDDCLPDGTCVTTVSGCPQCPHGACKYPPPTCIEEPNLCGTTGRCQADGTCAPILCDDGYECAEGSRCAVGSVRADGHACELIPCDDGWTCGKNTRCTVPADAASHGCTTLGCASDADCDCGYCVNSKCRSDLGVCSQAPV